MNVLFLMADQFRLDALHPIGGYGRTDALDALAADGKSFRRAITTAPECIPARFALASGLYPHQTGIWQNQGVTLSPSCWTWMQALMTTGYRTSVFGKTHFHEGWAADLRDDQGLMLGYGLIDVEEIGGPRASQFLVSGMTEKWEERGVWDAYRADFRDRFATKPWLARPSPLGLDLYYDTYIGRRALEYLSRYERSEPWFCWTSFAGPHEPWDAPAPYDTLHPSSEAPAAIPRGSGAVPGSILEQLFCSPEHSPMMTADEIAALRGNYAGNVTLIDDQIGAIIDHLKRADFYDDTLIIFTSDHGEMNGDHALIYKGNFLNSAVNIPLIIKPPKDFPLGDPSENEPLVELNDIGATIFDYIGVQPPSWMQGRSLRPIVEGRARYHRPYSISEFKGHTMIATQSLKCEFNSAGEVVFLINYAHDPLEQENIARSPAYERILVTMKDFLIDHNKKTSQRWTIALAQ